MSDEQERHVRRWLEAERADQLEEAETAFRALFRTMPRREPGPELEARILRAITGGTPGRSSWGLAGRVAAGLLSVAGLAGAFAALIWFAPVLTRALVSLAAWSAQALVLVFVALEEGLDVGALLLQAGQATRTVLATREATMVLLAVQATAVAALFALYRLLASEKEST